MQVHYGEGVAIHIGPSRAPSSVRAGPRLAELTQQFDVHPNQITTWRGQLLEAAGEVFGSNGHSEPAEPAIEVKTLHAKIGELALANDFMSGALGKAGVLPSAKR
ncbi:IS3 family transposase [soil metagenome]